MKDSAPARVVPSRTRHALSRLIHRPLVRRTDRNPGNLFEKLIIRQGRQVDAGDGALGDSDVRLAPETDVRHLTRDLPLRVGVEAPARVIVDRRRCLVEKGVYSWAREMTPIETH